MAAVWLDTNAAASHRREQKDTESHQQSKLTSGMEKILAKETSLSHELSASGDSADAASAGMQSDRTNCAQKMPKPEIEHDGGSEDVCMAKVRVHAANIVKKASPEALKLACDWIVESSKRIAICEQCQLSQSACCRKQGCLCKCGCVHAGQNAIEVVSLDQKCPRNGCIAQVASTVSPLELDCIGRKAPQNRPFQYDVNPRVCSVLRRGVHAASKSAACDGEKQAAAELVFTPHTSELLQILCLGRLQTDHEAVFKDTSELCRDFGLSPFTATALVHDAVQRQLCSSSSTLPRERQLALDSLQEAICECENGKTNVADSAHLYYSMAESVPPEATQQSAFVQQQLRQQDKITTQSDAKSPASTTKDHSQDGPLGPVLISVQCEVPLSAVHGLHQPHHVHGSDPAHTLNASCDPPKQAVDGGVVATRVPQCDATAQPKSQHDCKGSLSASSAFSSFACPATGPEDATSATESVGRSVGRCDTGQLEAESQRHFGPPCLRPTAMAAQIWDQQFTQIDWSEFLDTVGSRFADLCRVCAAADAWYDIASSSRPVTVTAPRTRVLVRLRRETAQGPQVYPNDCQKQAAAPRVSARALSEWVVLQALVSKGWQYHMQQLQGPMMHALRSSAHMTTVPASMMFAHVVQLNSEAHTVSAGGKTVTGVAELAAEKPATGGNTAGPLPRPPTARAAPLYALSPALQEKLRAAGSAVATAAHMEVERLSRLGFAPARAHANEERWWINRTFRSAVEAAQHADASVRLLRDIPPNIRIVNFPMHAAGELQFFPCSQAVQRLLLSPNHVTAAIESSTMMGAVYFTNQQEMILADSIKLSMRLLVSQTRAAPGLYTKWSPTKKTRRASVQQPPAQGPRHIPAGF